MLEYPIWIQLLFFTLGATLLYFSMMYVMSKREIQELEGKLLELGDNLDEGIVEESRRVSDMSSFDKVFFLANRHKLTLEFVRDLQADKKSDRYNSTLMIVQWRDIDKDWLIYDIGAFKNLNLKDIDIITIIYPEGDVIDFATCD